MCTVDIVTSARTIDYCMPAAPSSASSTATRTHSLPKVTSEAKRVAEAQLKQISDRAHKV